MTTAQVVKTLVTVNTNSPIQDYVHLDDQTQPSFEMTPGFKPLTVLDSVKSFGVCLQINCLVAKKPKHFQFGPHRFLNWDSLVLDWES